MMYISHILSNTTVLSPSYAEYIASVEARTIPAAEVGNQAQTRLEPSDAAVRLGHQQLNGGQRGALSDEALN